MPRKRKLTLADGYRIFDEHNLEVTVTGIKRETKEETAVPVESLFREMDITQYPPVPKVRPGRVTQNALPALVRLELFAQHSVGGGGELVTAPDGTKTVVGNSVRTYGPGVVHVPVELANHLAYQDMVAKQQDTRTFDGRTRYHVVTFRRGPNGGEAAVGIDVTDVPEFIQDGMDLLHFGLTYGPRIR